MVFAKKKNLLSLCKKNIEFSSCLLYNTNMNNYLVEKEKLKKLLDTIDIKEDKDKIIDTLLAQFGTFANVLDQSPDSLEIHGFSHAIACYLGSLRNYFSYTHPKISIGDRMTDITELQKRIMWDFSYKTYEFFAIFYFDVDMTVLSFRKATTNMENMVCFNTRQFLTEGILGEPVYACIVHNHPSGNLSPSMVDLEQTKNIMFQLKSLNIELLDHYIIGRGQLYSMKEDKVLF